MTKIYLVRHGQTDWNKKDICQGREDIPLNQSGVKQACKVGKELSDSNIHFAAFYSSPLSRAYKTMDIIKEELGMKSSLIQTSPLFIERDFGEVEGQSVYKAREVSENEELSKKVKGYENDLSVGKRMEEGLKSICRAYPDQNVLVVTHSHAIKGLLHYLYPEKYSFSFSLPNTSVSLFNTDLNGVVSAEVNIFHHK